MSENFCHRSRIKAVGRYPLFRFPEQYNLFTLFCKVLCILHYSIKILIIVLERFHERGGSLYGVPKSRTCDEIRPSYVYEASCQRTVSEALYGIPEDMKKKCIELTPDDMYEVMKEFDKNAQAIAARGTSRFALVASRALLAIL